MSLNLNNLKLPVFGVLKLKDLIKAVRNCKTQADERAVVAKESASIRTSFKEENHELRAINVAKLLYIHMMGYPAHFGQMECLKLVASPKFADKRLGYLGIMLLLDENQEVLTLVTNSLQNDLKHANIYVVGLALCTLGNISSVEMSRDLADDVGKLLGNSNAYVRKKAALCALRIIRKVPELMETYVSKTRVLLNEKNHGVLLTGITLMTEMCKQSDELKQNLKREVVPILVRHLKNLVSSGFSPEHDVSGVCDPFLQVKILRLMRLLGKGDREASEAMNDVLAQVATNTDSSKNVGHSILYETVLTILDIESESSLRVLAINILGKFLGNRDNNIRYVALTTLCRTTAAASATSDSSALQRHRNTIIDCLRDADISIRRRALDLSFFLINAQNIRLLTRELLSYLEIAETEVKAIVADRICDAASKYRPNKRWEIDTVLRVLRVAGAHVHQEVVNQFVQLVSTAAPELQQYTVRKLFNIVKTEGDKALTQEGLLVAMVWCVGEYGDVLVRGSTGGLGGLLEESLTSEEVSEDAKQDLNGELQVAPTEIAVGDLLESILRGPYATSAVKEYGVTACMKLATRFTDGNVVAKLRKLIEKYRLSMNIELQQRSVEYGQLFALDKATRDGVLERMPALESAVKDEQAKQQRQALYQQQAAAGEAKTNGSAGATASLVGGLGDELLGLSLGGPAPVAAAKAPANATDLLAGLLGGVAPATTSTPAPLGGGLDLLGSLAKPSTTSPTSAANMLGDLLSGAPAVAPAKPRDPLADLLGGAIGGGSFSPAPTSPAPAPYNPNTVYTVYNKNGFHITFKATRDSHPTENIVNTVHTVFQNQSSGQIDAINFQVAVPKSMKLAMQPPSATSIASGTEATQVFKIANPTKAVLKLRLKVTYTLNGMPVDDLVDFGSFEEGLWN